LRDKKIEDIINKKESWCSLFLLFFSEGPHY
jgi:hypothetical protein